MLFWRRMLWIVDFLGAILLMLEAEVYDRQIICGIGFIFVLICLGMLSRLRDE